MDGVAGPSGELASGEVRADVVVIGGGAAGAAAALHARKLGREVALLRRAWGATALFSGAADVAPEPLASPTSPRGEGRFYGDAARLLGERRPDHPYAVLRDRLGALPHALAFAAEATGGLLQFAPPAEENRCLLTALGTLKLAAGGVDTVIAGDLRRVGRVGIVGVADHPRWDPRMPARALSAAADGTRLRCEAFTVAVDFFGDDEMLLRPHELSARIRERSDEFVDSVKRALPPGSVELLLFPAFVGELGWLQESLSLRCAELPSLLPSLPGLRLQRRIDQRLQEAGVQLVAGEAFSADGTLTGLRVRDPSPRIPDPSDFDEGAPRGPPTAPPSWPVRANAVVLASGKFIGGGIERHGRLREPIFELPVWLDGSVDEGRWLGDVTDPALEGEQAVFRAGLRVDRRLRPLDDEGRVAAEGIFACGALLYGNDAARDGAGLGLAWFTGWLAGLEAAKGG